MLRPIWDVGTSLAGTLPGRELLDYYIWYYNRGYAISFEGKGKTKTCVKLHRKLMVNDSNIFYIQYIDHVKRIKAVINKLAELQNSVYMSS